MTPNPTTPNEAAMRVAALYDKTGREILPGDTLKVDHFIGPRRKRHYMFKFVLEIVVIGSTDPKQALKLLHLSTGLPASAYYYELQDGRTLPDYEIVQGYGTDGTPYDQRPRHAPATSRTGRNEGKA